MTRPAAGRECRSPIQKLLLRRIWLPGPLYRALPGLYMTGGLTALTAGLFAPEPHWLWGYLALPGIALVHGGLTVLSLRRRYRRARRPGVPRASRPVFPGALD